MSSAIPGNLVDEFEEAFQSCLEVCTQDEAVNEIDKNEIRAEAEQTTIKFIELARQMEAFFLQKRFLLSALKPELIVKEDINDLRAELIRKEDLIKRHYEKISVWQNILADLQGYSKSPAAASQQQPPQQNAIINADPLTVPSPLVSGSGGQIPGPGTGQFSQQQQQLALQQQQHQQLQQQIQQQQAQQGPIYMPQRSPYGPADVTPVQLQGPLAYLEKTTSNIDGQR